MTSIDHLHAETHTIPVNDHLALLSKQYLARTLQPSHPSHSVVTAPSGPRNMKHTLLSRFRRDVESFLDTSNTLPPENYTRTINSLHTSTVQQAIQSRAPNRILQTAPPPISDEEITLPRPHRTKLSQLRSGFCSSLNDYLERIGRAPSPLCPSCGVATHNVPHIFSCPLHPTTLRVGNLWDRPRTTAAFLASLPFFKLPPIDRPPPQPPPYPPPPGHAS